MAVRQRFKPAEREAFQPGTMVEWLHGSHWQPGKITGSVQRDAPGDRPFYPVVHQGKATRTISRGASLRGYPGSIRMPQGVPAGTRCAWFARCERDATHYEQHPTLGPVAACDECPNIGR